MKNLLTTILVLLISCNVFSQKFGPSYVVPDSSHDFVSVYISMKNLLSINTKTKKVKKTKNSFNFFAFKITTNTIFYNTKYKSLTGSFIDINSQKDTLIFFMSEQNGDVLNIKIFYNDHNKAVILIEERKLNNKIKLYYSDECTLTRKSL